MKHTPGPWNVEDQTYVFASNTLRVADCECDGQTMTLKEAHANALLISKAPAMLNALEEFLACGTNVGHNQELIQTITTLIAEVKGN